MKKGIFFFMGMLLCQTMVLAQSKKNIAVIEGQFSNLKKDTIRLIFYPEKFGNMETTAIYQTQIIENGHFKFSINGIKKPGYIRLYSYSQSYSGMHYLMMHNYIIEPGDRINIAIDKNFLVFKGIGSEKYKCLYAIDTLKTFEPSKANKPITIEDRNKDVDNSLLPMANKHGLNLRLKKLQTYKKVLSPLIYQTIECDLICDWVRDAYNWYLFDWSDAFKLPDSIIRKRKMIDFFNNFFNIEPNVLMGAKLISANYPDLAMIKLFMSWRIKNNKKRLGSHPELYEEIIKMPEPLKSKLMVTLFVYRARMSTEYSYISSLNDANKYLGDSYFGNILKSVLNKKSKGIEAFNFSLMDTNQKKVQLHDFRGKTVLLDFWFTGCLACVGCAKSLQKVIANFKEDTNLVFISISIDRDYNKWMKSLKEGEYASIENEINLYTNGLGSDNPLIKYYEISGYPTLMLVDKKGKLFSANAIRPDSERGVERLTEIIKSAMSEN